MDKVTTDQILGFKDGVESGNPEQWNDKWNLWKNRSNNGGNRNN
ncbi:MAG: hypothetical protein ACLR6B_22100 [Blautia sp.]